MWGALDGSQRSSPASPGGAMPALAVEPRGSPPALRPMLQPCVRILPAQPVRTQAGRRTPSTTRRHGHALFASTRCHDKPIEPVSLLHLGLPALCPVRLQAAASFARQLPRTPQLRGVGAVKTGAVKMSIYVAQQATNSFWSPGQLLILNLPYPCKLPTPAQRGPGRDSDMCITSEKPPFHHPCSPKPPLSKVPCNTSRRSSPHHPRQP